MVIIMALSEHLQQIYLTELLIKGYYMVISIDDLNNTIKDLQKEVNKLEKKE